MHASDEHIMVQQHLSFKIECSDQSLAASRPPTCDRHSDPHRASSGLCSCWVLSFSVFTGGSPRTIPWSNQLFRQRQVCLKDLHRDQHRRMTVPEPASHNRQLMLTSNTLCWCRRSHISLDVLPLSRCQLSRASNTSTHGDYCALITFLALSRHSTYSPPLRS